MKSDVCFAGTVSKRRTISNDVTSFSTSITDTGVAVVVVAAAIVVAVVVAVCLCGCHCADGIFRYFGLRDRGYEKE